MQNEFKALPRIIQGGMGVAVSGWKLAREVSRAGELGVVSGTALNYVFAQRLQEGDEHGDLRRALAHFPIPGVAEKILAEHFDKLRGADRRAVRNVPMFTMKMGPSLQILTIVANFCEVWLAKEGHEGVVGINLLEKVQLPNLPSLYGAMLAGVDYVLMGAGIPREIPGALDAFSRNEPGSLRIAVEGAPPEEEHRFTLDPKKLFGDQLPPLKRPDFLAIISSDVLGEALLKRANGKINGFIIENDLAGGHNAPPRGQLRKNERGEPIYGPRDTANLDRMKAFGLPFWLAGDYGSPERFAGAIAAGAAGVQIGSPFAFCEESGMEPAIRRQVLEQVANGTCSVYTDPDASPTGFPFKVIELEGTGSEREVYHERPRLCQLGLLRNAYKREDGHLGYRCAAEPVDDFTKKGGKEEETVGRKCLCNGLLANIGLPQEHKDGYVELPIVTGGDSVKGLATFLKPGSYSYSARDVLDHLRGPATAIAEPGGSIRNANVSA